MVRSSVFHVNSMYFISFVRFAPRFPLLHQKYTFESNIWCHSDNGIEKGIMPSKRGILKKLGLFNFSIYHSSKIFNIKSSTKKKYNFKCLISKMVGFIVRNSQPISVNWSRIILSWTVASRFDLGFLDWKLIMTVNYGRLLCST